jgi:hypothetical protein
MGTKHVTAESIYAATGQPRPKDIEQILYLLLNEDFTTAFQSNFVMISSNH